MQLSTSGPVASDVDERAMTALALPRVLSTAARAAMLALVGVSVAVPLASTLAGLVGG